MSGAPNDDGRSARFATVAALGQCQIVKTGRPSRSDAGAVRLVHEIWLLTGAVCVLAGAVRGFTSFGLALILVMAAALWMPPAQIVPIALILDLFAGMRMLPHVHRDIDRPGVALMTLGAVPAIPVGIYLLAVVPEPTMRLAIRGRRAGCRDRDCGWPRRNGFRAGD